jgi:hypothetical protein
MGHVEATPEAPFRPFCDTPARRIRYNVTILGLCGPIGRVWRGAIQ